MPVIAGALPDLPFCPTSITSPQAGSQPPHVRAACARHMGCLGQCLLCMQQALEGIVSVGNLGCSWAVSTVRHAGRKSRIESFAGANVTFTIEAMMGDRRALQVLYKLDLPYVMP